MASPKKMSFASSMWIKILLHNSSSSVKTSYNLAWDGFGEGSLLRDLLPIRKFVMFCPGSLLVGFEGPFIWQAKISISIRSFALWPRGYDKKERSDRIDKSHVFEWT